MKIDMQTVYFVAFWATVSFTVLGSMIGLLGVWVEDFWDNPTGVKLIMTDLILAGTSLVVALMVRWLWLST